MDKKRMTTEEIYCAYYFKVNSYIKRKINSADDADDLTQDVFEYCFRKYDDYDESRSSISTWLFLIANSRLKNYFRDRKNSDCIDDYENVLPAAENDMDRAVFLEQLKSVLTGAIDTLPENQRKAVIYKYFHDMSHLEIAQMLGISEGNSRVLLTRALDRLKEQLKDMEY